MNSEPVTAFSTPDRQGFFARLLGLRMSDPPAPSRVVGVSLGEITAGAGLQRTGNTIAETPVLPTKDEREAWFEAFTAYHAEEIYGRLLRAETTVESATRQHHHMISFSSCREDDDYEWHPKMRAYNLALNRWHFRQIDLRQQQPVDLAEGPALELA